jgi:hypothetical protein
LALGAAGISSLAKTADQSEELEYPGDDVVVCAWVAPGRATRATAVAAMARRLKKLRGEKQVETIEEMLLFGFGSAKRVGPLM